MPARINKDTVLEPGTIEAILKELDRMVAGFQSRLGQIKTEFKGLYDQFGQPLKITGQTVSDLNKAADSVSKLSQEQKKLTEAERQAIKLKNQLAAASAKLTPENIKYAAAVKSAREEARRLTVEQQKLTGTFKPGFFSNLVTQIKGLAAAYLSLSAAINLGKNIFNVTKQLDVLNQSFKYLITDQKDLADSQAFLGDITKRYGLELISTSQSYLKFRASIQGANFDLKESQKLFETVGKAGAVLGLNAQRMELVFLALEQMISKGTISTEELRRQLGDNLPGAMRIMANALGVTIPKLLQMVKNNEVLAEDALPKFRVELEKAYGIENLNKIDNMQASVNRLKNTWTNFVRGLKASDEFTAAINFLNALLGGNRALVSSADVYSKKLEQIKKEIKGFLDFGDEEYALVSFKASLRGLVTEIANYGKEIKRLEGSSPIKEGTTRKQMTDQINSLKETKKAYEDLERFLQSTLLGDWIKNLFPEEPPPAPVTDETLDKLNQELKLASGIIEKLEARKALYEYRKKKATSDEVIQQLNSELRQINLQIDAYNDLGKAIEKNIKTQKIKKSDTDILFIERMEEAIDALESRNEQMKNERAALYEDLGLMDDTFYKNDLGYLKDALQDKLITEKQYFIFRVRLWMENNEKLIDATQQFVESFLGLLDELNRGQLEAAQKEVDIQDEKISNLKAQLDEEKQLKDEGKANDYDRLVTQIADTERVRDEANKKLEKAQKREAAIQLAAQASDIITATANIIESYSEIPIVGVILGLAAAASMITAFAAYKSKINSISKYAEGEVDIDGKPHSQGGKIVEIEGHESIINKESTARSKKLLNAINNGVLSDLDLYKLNFSHNLKDSNYQKYDSVLDVVKELQQSRQINNRMLTIMENTPVIINHKDGSIEFRWPNGSTAIRK